MTTTSTTVIEFGTEYRLYPDKGCRWGGASCLTCPLEECVLDNPGVIKQIQSVTKRVYKPRQKKAAPTLVLGDRVVVARGRTRYVGQEAGVTEIAERGIRVEFADGSRRWVNPTSLTLVR